MAGTVRSWPVAASAIGWSVRRSTVAVPVQVTAQVAVRVAVQVTVQVAVHVAVQIRRGLRDDRGGVSTIAGIAALTVAVLAAAGIVASVMMDHANAIPAPGSTPAADN